MVPATEANGLVTGGEGSPGVRRLAADVRFVLDRLGVERAIVVGHSLGGMVVLQLASDAAPVELERTVSGLALVSTTAGPYLTVPGWRRLVRVSGSLSVGSMLLADRLGVKGLPNRDLRWWASRLGFGAEASPEQVRFVQAMISATSLSTVTGLLVSLGLFDVSEHLERIQVPSLVVVGTHDRLTPPRHAHRAVGALRSAELVELPRCGHMPMLERRHEFSKTLAEFASKSSAGRRV
jgi:pimeloyl-ACP methyl ester carboxylesterase